MTWEPAADSPRAHIAGPIIIVGIALGFVATKQGNGGDLLPSNHKNLGQALLGIYILQCLLGFIIHKWKPASFSVSRRRPVQNYAHAIIGLATIGLAFWQVRFCGAVRREGGTGADGERRCTRAS